MSRRSRAAVGAPLDDLPPQNALNLSPGDELNVVEASKGRLAVEKVDKRAEFLRQVEQFQFPLPEGYKFDRDEANER
ncbi:MULTISPECIES: AbrB/MazE/SpoVT family DNA-binding domain-containing protein [unclassified Bradyrhizobium]